jgi:hypothetical protein
MLSSAVLDRLQLRRVLSIQDHHFPPGLLRWQRMSPVKRSVIFKPLFGPRRCIAVPMVFTALLINGSRGCDSEESVWTPMETMSPVATPKQEMKRRGNQASGAKQKKNRHGSDPISR